jgi:hypothetical protein
MSAIRGAMDCFASLAMTPKWQFFYRTIGGVVAIG